MANNRLWAVCKDDNECACLAKSYGSWEGGFHDCNDFFKKHVECPSQKGGGENIVWVDENDERVILYDFSRRKRITGEDGLEYDTTDYHIYLKGDEEKPAYKEWLAKQS